MKNIIQTIALFTATLFLFSCTGEEDDLFDKSSAERLNEAQSQYTQNLYESPNGWVMQYFATGGSPGYNFLMKFDKSGAVKIAAQNEYTNGYKAESSLFEIITDNGPVLTFNTYNTLFHHFSNPEEPNGYGLEGDYEFVVMNMNKDLGTADLKGKKRQTSVRMYQLPEGVEWESYFNLLNDMDRAMFGKGDVVLSFHSGSTISKARNGSKHIFSLLLPGEDAALPTEVPFIITEKGLKFHKPFERGGATSQYFELSPDQAKIVSKEDANVYFSGPAIADFMYVNPGAWVMEKADMSDDLKAAYAQMEAEFKTAFAGKRNLEYVGLGLKAPGTRCFTIKAATTALANFYLKETIGSDGKSVQIVTADFTMDANARNFYSKVPSIKGFIDLLNNTFQLSSKKPLSLIDISYTSGNQQTHFTVTR